MDRLVQFNVLAMSGRAVEAAGDVDMLLLDKTGTITLGNRQASEFIPLPGVERTRLADAAQLASLADETPEGRSIVVLAKEKFGLRGREMAAMHAHFIPFTAQTRMSGVDIAALDRKARDASARARSTAVDSVACRPRPRRRQEPLATRASRNASQSPAARRLPWRRTASCSASSI